MGGPFRLYVTGADGMLGTALRTRLAADPDTEDWVVHGVSVADFDIGDADAVRRSIAEFGPDAVVHTAAHAIVDDCETDPRLAMRVNVAGTRNVAQACAEAGARLVYVSSDYVFDGVEPPEGGYREGDCPNPVNVYGMTKLAGERIAAAVADHVVVRTSWLFGGADERTDNVLAMVRDAARGVRPVLIADQFSCPTYTADLAEALVFLLRSRFRGTVHATNQGSASWFDVAAVALDARAATGIALADCAFVADRPRDSTLNTDLLDALGHRMPDWPDAVRRFRAGLAVSGSSAEVAVEVAG